jgi:uncharacterized membrane protein
MRDNVRRIVYGAALAALVFAVTWSVRIPIPATNGGYVNFGDVAIYMSSYVFCGPLAVLGAAIGSALADLLAGATVYIVPTFVIKGLMAAAAVRIIKKGGKKAAGYILACAAGGAVMTAGYALFELAFFGPAYAAASLLPNALQWLGGAAIASALYPAAKRLAPIVGKGQ